MIETEEYTKMETLACFKTAYFKQGDNSMKGMLIDPYTETIQKVTLQKYDSYIWRLKKYWTDTDYLYQIREFCVLLDCYDIELKKLPTLETEFSKQKSLDNILFIDTHGLDVGSEQKYFTLKLSNETNDCMEVAGQALILKQLSYNLPDTLSIGTTDLMIHEVEPLVTWLGNKNTTDPFLNFKAIH